MNFCVNIFHTQCLEVIIKFQARLQGWNIFIYHRRCSMKSPLISSSIFFLLHPREYIMCTYDQSSFVFSELYAKKNHLLFIYSSFFSYNIVYGAWREVSCLVKIIIDAFGRIWKVRQSYEIWIEPLFKSYVISAVRSKLSRNISRLITVATHVKCLIKISFFISFSSHYK